MKLPEALENIKQKYLQWRLKANVFLQCNGRGTFADYEFSAINEIVQKERFRYFIKVPELAAFYNEIIDYRTAKDIGIDRPEKKKFCITSPDTTTRRIYSKISCFRKKWGCDFIGEDTTSRTGRESENVHCHQLYP